jgi:hypothetical protein
MSELFGARSYVESCLQFAINEYDEIILLDDGAAQYFVGIAPIA